MKAGKPVKAASAPGTLERRLASYGSMSIAIAAAAVAPAAHASIVENVVNMTTPVGGGIVFNVTTGDATLIQSNQLTSSRILPGATAGNFGLFNSNPPPIGKAAWFIASSLNEFEVAPNANQPNYSSVARITQNTVVGPPKTFKNGFGSQMLADNSFGSLAPGNWKTLGAGYVGLQFQLNNQTDYGWAYININPNYTITLDFVGYDTSGLPATTPSVPEPNSLLLLVMGAAGIGAYRRKIAAKGYTRL